MDEINVDEGALKQQLKAQQHERMQAAGRELEAVLEKYRATLAIFAVSPGQKIPLPLKELLLPGWEADVQLLPLD